MNFFRFVHGRRCDFFFFLGVQKNKRRVRDYPFASKDQCGNCVRDVPMAETAVQSRKNPSHPLCLPSQFLDFPIPAFRISLRELDSARCTNEGLFVYSRVAWLPRQTAQFQCSHKLKNLQVCCQAACATYTDAGSEQPLCAG